MENMDFIFQSDDDIKIKKFFVVICYDICDDKRRRNLVKYLESFSIRAQKSVFEGYLPKGKYELLKRHIPRYISDKDSIRIYKLTGNGDVTAWGNGELLKDEDVIII